MEAHITPTEMSAIINDYKTNNETFTCYTQTNKDKAYIDYK